MACSHFRLIHSLFLLSLFALDPRPAAALQDTTTARPDTISAARDTAHVTYRTQEVVFLSAAAVVAVGQRVRFAARAPGVAAAAPPLPDG